MKLILKQRKFKKNLENVVKALPHATALPSLYGILIRANQSNITLIASDGNFSIKEVVEVNEEFKVEESGEILVPGKLFKEVFNKQNEIVEIKMDKNLVKISSENLEASINLLKVEDYPVINFEVIGKEVYLDVERLKKAIKNVSFAAAENDRRLILNGVNLQAHAGKLIITATNSFRLAQEKINLNSNVEFNITLLSRNLKDFLPNDAKGEILLQVDNTRLMTTFKTTTIFSKLIDGVYPEINKLIPTNFQYQLEIGIKELIDTMERAIVVSDSERKIILVSLSEGELKIESKRKEMGTSIALSKNLLYQGEKFQIPFNAQFLKEAINRFEGKVQILFEGENRPFVIKSDSNQDLIQLILPHRSF